MSHETRYSELDSSLKRYREDIFDDKYKRLDPNDVSRTITAHIAKDGYWYIHPRQDRTLTVREAARLQTFPDAVRFAGPPSAAFRQIGNAVPVVLGRRIGEAVIASLQAGRSARISTGTIADELATWFRSTPPTRLPWLAASNRWTVLQADILWSRLSEHFATQAWAAVRHLATPEQTLDALPLLRRLAAQWQRESRCGQLEAAARWFVDHGDVLMPSATAKEMAAAPGVSVSTADLACRVVPGDSEDPVLAGFGVLRVAARFFGGDVDRRNRLSDGRLALARMIGGDESSHEAHLALIELANGVCSPGRPACGVCPLEPWCAEAMGRDVQPTLPVTNRDPQRRQERPLEACP